MASATQVSDKESSRQCSRLGHCSGGHNYQAGGRAAHNWTALEHKWCYWSARVVLQLRPAECSSLAASGLGWGLIQWPSSSNIIATLLQSVAAVMV